MMDAKCMEKVDIFISARDLPHTQTFSETDSFAAVFLKDNLSGVLNLIGNTPVINNTIKPDWADGFTLDYMFEVVQEITIKVFQYKEGAQLTQFDKHQLIGESTFNLANLMVASGQHLTLQIGGGLHKGGHFEIRAESHTNSRDLFCVQFSGKKLANKDGFFGTSDPFLVVSRMNEDGAYTVVWKSPKIDNSLNPVWQPVKIPMTALCNNDQHRPLKLEVFDWDSNGKHQSMGAVEGTSVHAMLSAAETPMEVVEAKKKKEDKKYTHSGHLLASRVSIEHRPTFSDFIAGGCEISLVAALDFTGSNGDPALPASLHYISPHGAYNQYQQAIHAVGQVLDSYDSNHTYPVFGFGAKKRSADGGWTECLHDFKIPESGEEVKGVEGIMKVYKEVIPTLFFSGPTLFAPIINQATGIALGANTDQQKQKYTILLIITDGTINDMEATKAAIIQAAQAPLSIVIIGVGSADFGGMEALDSDKGLLTQGGHTAIRDVVQFVPARPNEQFPVLAQKVLAEIPEQLLRYFEIRNIRPNGKK